MKIMHICGARPNFMKIAPLVDAMVKRPEIESYLVHTGQHYDENMSKLFFDELGIPKPDIDLEVGSASHAAQTAEIMKRFEPVLLEQKPDLVSVVGDVNSTIACALVSTKLGVKVAHVEAGLRSYDRQMPEEVNRVLTDQISDFLFTTEASAEDNLRKEGIGPEKIFFVGNCMIDTLMKNRERALQRPTLEKFGLEEKGYAVMTLHRPSNVDEAGPLRGIFEAVSEIGQRIPVLFPIHPRTRKMFESFGLAPEPEEGKGIRMVEPLGYLDFLCLMARSRMILTDSGGIQEESTVLGVPCLTLRFNTERPVTLTQGTNQLVGNKKEKILEAAGKVFAGKIQEGRTPDLWDGGAADRITDIVIEKLG
jgi:UDP-N-acetylglucosamine 2-epimerase (non-hydrolysing)